MEMELWRDIPGYEGIYQASNFGNIRTCENKTTYTERHGVRHWKQRVLKQKITQNKRGRTDARISLWENGNEKTWLVARLVGMAWCVGYKDGMTINHINGNSKDNRSCNLEWVSLKENIQKGFSEGLFLETQKPVLLIKEGDKIKFNSMADASRFLGKKSGYVSNCLNKKREAVSANGDRYKIQITAEGVR